MPSPHAEPMGSQALPLAVGQVTSGLYETLRREAVG